MLVEVKSEGSKLQANGRSIPIVPATVVVAVAVVVAVIVGTIGPAAARHAVAIRVVAHARALADHGHFLRSAARGREAANAPAATVKATSFFMAYSILQTNGQSTNRPLQAFLKMTATSVMTSRDSEIGVQVS
jgi:hypothetical protein